MPGFAGFDRGAYPGDATMAWLRANSNLVWCGYYLGPTPSHPGTTWMGKRAQLSGAGWGIAPVFVGQQVIPPGSLNPSAATGVTDGNTTVQLMLNEGFPPGAYVYLDLENGPPLTPAQQDYVGSWCDTVQQGGFGPGVYCSHLLAAGVHTLRPACRIWAFKVDTNQPHPVPSPYPSLAPAGCGYSEAHAWQLGQQCMITVPVAGPGPMQVDLSSALTVDPGAPD